jgi:hypothetical protein
MVGKEFETIHKQQTVNDKPSLIIHRLLLLRIFFAYLITKVLMECGKLTVSAALPCAHS